LKSIAVFIHLAQKKFQAFASLVSMMKKFDRLLKTECNQQTNGDDRDVDEEALPRMHGFMRCMYVQHRSLVRLAGNRKYRTTVQS